MANSKQKGSAFERKICKQLSLWISDGQEDDLLWRSAMSGGSATVARRKGKNKTHQCGDISAIAEKGHLLTNAVIIECKHYKMFDWVALVYGDKGNIALFWDTLMTDCKHFDKKPFLILKQNCKPVLLCLNKSLKKLRPIKAMLHGKYFYELDTVCEKYTINEFLEEYGNGCTRLYGSNK